MRSRVCGKPRPANCSAKICICAPEDFDGEDVKTGERDASRSKMPTLSALLGAKYTFSATTA